MTQVNGDYVLIHELFFNCQLIIVKLHEVSIITFEFFCFIFLSIYLIMLLRRLTFIVVASHVKCFSLKKIRSYPFLKYDQEKI